MSIMHHGNMASGGKKDLMKPTLLHYLPRTKTRCHHVTRAPRDLAEKNVFLPILTHVFRSCNVTETWTPIWGATKSNRPTTSVIIKDVYEEAEQSWTTWLYVLYTNTYVCGRIHPYFIFTYNFTHSTSTTNMLRFGQLLYRALWLQILQMNICKVEPLLMEIFKAADKQVRHLLGILILQILVYVYIHKYDKKKFFPRVYFQMIFIVVTHDDKIDHHMKQHHYTYSQIVDLIL